MLQVHGNANIIVVMSDKQQPKNAFVREQIKDKPKNYKRMWVRLGESAACGGVFALAVCLVLLFMIPVLRQEEGSVPDTGAQDSQQASVEETEQGSEEKEETQTPEERQPMTLDDYQQIQTELYAISPLLRSRGWSVIRTGLTTLMNGKVRAVARSLEKVEVNSGFLRRKKRLKMLQRSKLPL